MNEPEPFSYLEDSYLSNYSHIDPESLIILESIPMSAAVLTENFTIVRMNESFQTHFLNGKEINTQKMLLGNVLSCVNSAKEKGCLTTAECKGCAYNTFMKHFKYGEKQSFECRIPRMINNAIHLSDYRMHVSPLTLNSGRFLLLTLEDINEHKHKDMLNKTFLHDVLNTACGLTSLLEYLKIADENEDTAEFMAMIERQTAYIIEEIKAHKELLNADVMSRYSKLAYTTTDSIIEMSVEVISHFAALNNTTIKIDTDEFESCLLYTDHTLLRRVIVNILKNAIESSDEKEEIHCGCTRSGSNAVFYVKNKTHMDELTKNSLFNTLYTTKEKGSGIGTFSIKILTEKYLKGAVTFESEAGKGTAFYISIPVTDDAHAFNLSTEHTLPLS